MNRNYFSVIYSAIFIMAFSSCSRSDEIIESGNFETDFKTLMLNKSLVNNLTYDEFRNYSTGFEKMAYSVMSSATKARIWKERIKKFMDTEPDKGKTRELEKLTNLLTPGVFEANELSPSVKAWIDGNKNRFGENRLRWLLMSMHDSEEAIAVKNELLVAAADGNCTCNRAQDFCSSGYDCVSTLCHSGDKGCGWFWASTCNGNCRKQPV